MFYEEVERLKKNMYNLWDEEKNSDKKRQQNDKNSFMLRQIHPKDGQSLELVPWDLAHSLSS